MRIKPSIDEVFRLMGLSSEEERKAFDFNICCPSELGLEKPLIFYRYVPDTDSLDKETKDAELE
ncbi:hypothetical protein H8E88_12395 [candidate division KSB1 bacterium]|nr:hypothetical protein [candidate division KSB1 bacterium]